MVRFPPPGQTFPAVSDEKAMFAFPSPALMQTANSAATADRGSGMGRLAGFHAVADGKLRVSKTAHPSIILGAVRPLIIAAAMLFAALVPFSASYAQSGPFAGMAGVWSGGGTVTLDDGSTERIRCRATYAVSRDGSGLNQSLTCASDSYRFNLASNVVASGGSLSGTWSESSRGITGSLEGRGANGNFQVVASAPGFTASISLTTRGNRQSVVIRAESQFRGASISLSRS
jgi:hypothetical protein